MLAHICNTYREHVKHTQRQSYAATTILTVLGFNMLKARRHKEPKVKSHSSISKDLIL